jgi:hypothetical protein
LTGYRNTASCSFLFFRLQIILPRSATALVFWPLFPDLLVFSTSSLPLLYIFFTSSLPPLYLLSTPLLYLFSTSSLPPLYLLSTPLLDTDYYTWLAQFTEYERYCVNVVNTCAGDDDDDDNLPRGEDPHPAYLPGNLLTHIRCGVVERRESNMDDLNKYVSDGSVIVDSDGDVAEDPELHRPISAAALGLVDDPADLEQMRRDELQEQRGR